MKERNDYSFLKKNLVIFTPVKLKQTPKKTLTTNLNQISTVEQHVKDVSHKPIDSINTPNKSDYQFKGDNELNELKILVNLYQAYEINKYKIHPNNTSSLIDLYQNYEINKNRFNEIDTNLLKVKRAFISKNNQLFYFNPLIVKRITEV